MPSLTALPDRTTVSFEDETVKQVADLLAQAGEGQGVAILDEPVDSPQKARVRGRKMKDALAKAPFNIETRLHIQTVQAPKDAVPKKGNTPAQEAVPGKFMPVVSKKAGG